MVPDVVKYGMLGSKSSSNSNRITDPFIVANGQLSVTAARKPAPAEKNYVNSTHNKASQGESKHSSPSGLK